MALGLPVVVSDFPLWRRVVGKAECGLVVDPTNLVQVADAIAWLCDHPAEAAEMGARGRRTVLGEYRWETQFAKLRAFYEQVLGIRQQELIN
jgi:glycosyltransferase involved in cell wall biosynthesis